MGDTFPRTHIDPPLCCRLRPIDIEFMRRLHQKVNLIPVIAKSDTMTDEEITLFKARVLSDISHHQIEIFHAPVYDNEDEETLAENEEIVVSRELVQPDRDSELTIYRYHSARFPLPSWDQTLRLTHLMEEGYEGGRTPGE
jgi:hypothetical protein